MRAAYAGAEVLHDVSFSVPRHGFVLLVGANGAGKSTICSVLAGLHATTTGRVVLHGHDVTAAPAHERVRRGLFVAPEYRGIFPGLTVEENLALWIRDRSARHHALERFPMLAERRRTPAGNLSGGQQQLLTIAPALERPPELLVLDEPSLGLSPIATSQVLDALAELHALGTTILLVEEHTRRALAFAQQVVLLDLGRVRWIGPAAEFGDDLSREVYLGRSVATPERVSVGVAGAAPAATVAAPPATTVAPPPTATAAVAPPPSGPPADRRGRWRGARARARRRALRRRAGARRRVAADRPGSIHGLIGPNGAGKTTLFDVVSGVRAPDTGRVVLGGVDVTRWSSSRRARAGLRRTFQRVQVFGRLSVADNLLVALEHHGGGGGLPADVVAWPGRRHLEHERRERVAEVAELCGLAAVLDRPAGTLPVALARQVELGRALVDEPTVLLLDEPTSGLDDAESARLGGLIDRVARERRCAIVVVEHNVPFVMQHCATVTALDLGRVIAEGPAAEVQDDPAVQSAYFG